MVHCIVRWRPGRRVKKLGPMSRAPTKPGSEAITAAVHARRKALSDLMHSRALGVGDVADAVRQITETAAQCLETERTSVWRLIEGGSAIECIDLYERSHARHSAGARIFGRDAPRYFEALYRERFITAHDASNVSKERSTAHTPNSAHSSRSIPSRMNVSFSGSRATALSVCSRDLSRSPCLR